MKSDEAAAKPNLLLSFLKESKLSLHILHRIAKSKFAYTKRRGNFTALELLLCISFKSPILYALCKRRSNAFSQILKSCWYKSYYTAILLIHSQHMNDFLVAHTRKCSCFAAKELLASNLMQQFRCRAVFHCIYKSLYCLG